MRRRGGRRWERWAANRAQVEESRFGGRKALKLDLIGSSTDRCVVQVQRGIPVRERLAELSRAMRQGQESAEWRLDAPVLGIECSVSRKIEGLEAKPLAGSVLFSAYGLDVTGSCSPAVRKSD